jgi:DNA-binding MarR family transcriptional regulator
MANVARRQHTVNRATGVAADGNPVGELVALVFRLDALLRASGDRLAGPAGQTTARWRILATAENGPMTVAQIAADWSMARQSVQRVADLLARDGLIEYEDNPAHRRAKLVRLTPVGESALLRIRAAQQAWASDVAASVGKPELRAANQTLSRVIEALAAPETGRTLADRQGTVR